MAYPFLVSVLTTAFNREQYIAEAIESVLLSTLKEFELIIVDDCSTDNTVVIAKSYEAKDERVKVYVNEKNLGDYPNRNKAASYAKGKYIKYLDSDDIIYPHCLEVMVKSMEQFPEAGFGLCSKPDSQFRYPTDVSPHDTYSEHFNGFGHFDRAPGSSIMKKSSFDAVGGFSGKRMIGDYEMWFVLARQFPLVKIERDLLWYRSHSGQEFNSDYAKKYVELRKAVFEEAMNHPECPLSSKEKELIAKRIRAKKVKSSLLNTALKIQKSLRLD